MDHVRLLLHVAIGRDLEVFGDLGALLGSVLPLVLAALHSGLIGLGQTFRDRPSGLRTFELISVGSASAVLDFERFDISPGDQRRFVQGLRPGIGLLNEGIMRASFSAPSVSVLRSTVHQLQALVILLVTEHSKPSPRLA